MQMKTIDHSEYLRPVSEILDYNMNGSASVPSILQSWSKNKQDLYERFGNKTIVKTDEISLEVEDESEISASFRQYKVKGEQYFTTKRKHNEFWDFLNYGVGVEGFKENLVRYDWDSRDRDRQHGIDVNADGYKPSVKISKGAKFSKSLKAFFDLRNDESGEQADLLKDLQSLYSTYRQNFSSKRQGRLFLSIDPYDYLTISDNNHNWSSCHSMYDGEYRVGNLNYMADGVTVVGDYASDDLCDEDIDAFHGIMNWNSKRWRVLIHMEVVDGKMTAVYNKQYPFKSEKLLEELDKLVQTVCEDANPSTFLPYEDVRRNFITMGYDTCHYNDLGRGGECFVRMDNQLLESAEPSDGLIIGEPVLCLECGNHITDRADSGRCDYCESDYYCEDCDGYYNEDDMVYIEEEDIYVCYSCYEERHAQCGECGDEYHREDLRYVELLNKEMCYNCIEKLQGQKATLVYLINDVVRQMVDQGKTREELEPVYVDIHSEVLALIEEEREKGRLLISTMLCDDNVYRTDNAHRLDAVAVQSVFANKIRTNHSIRTSRYMRSTFTQLTEYEDCMPDVTKIIVTGSTNQDNLNKHLASLYGSMAILGLDKDMLDYSGVRVI